MQNGAVDFIKCDDICRMDMPSAEAEIIMLHRAIKKCGRDIVLSLSPGPAKLDKAWIYEKYSNMWRITVISGIAGRFFLICLKDVNIGEPC